MSWETFAVPRVTEVPTANHSDSWNPWNHPTAWQSLRTWLIGAAVLGVGIWGVMTQAVGEHVTDCGFDAQGAYAKVRVNNLLGFAHEQDVEVEFSLDGGAYNYEYGLSDVRVPALARVTTVVHGRFPRPRQPGGPKGEDDHHIVQGRTVYRYRPYASLGRLVSKEFAEEHPNRTSKEVVPDASHILDCSIYEENNSD